MTPFQRAGRHARATIPRAGSAGVRTGRSLPAIPKASNQSCTSGDDRRWKIVRCRTGSTSSACAAKATRLKSRSSSTTGVAEHPGHLVDDVLQVRAHLTSVARPLIQMSEISARYSSVCSWDRRRLLPNVSRSSARRPEVPVFSSSVLAVSHRPQVRRLITTSSASRKLVGRFIAGDDLDTAIAPVRALVGRGMLVTVDHLGEDIAGRRPTPSPPARPTSRCSTVSTSSAWRTRSRCRSSSRRSARPCRATASRIALEHAAAICAAAGRGRHHRHARHGGPHHGRLHSRRSSRCLRTRVPVGRRGAPVDAAPHRGRLPPSSPGRAPGCGWSRAPTTNRTAWRSPIPTEIDLAYVRGQ